MDRKSGRFNHPRAPLFDWLFAPVRPIPIPRWLAAHFQRFRERSPWSFCWRASVEYLVIAVSLALITSLLGWKDPEPSMNAREFFKDGVLIAPIVETFLLQVIPIGVARACQDRFGTQVVVSTVAFALAHLSNGRPLNALIAGCVGGFYLAFTYAHWRERSPWTAFWTTALCHAMNNGFGFVWMLAFHHE